MRRFSSMPSLGCRAQRCLALLILLAGIATASFAGAAPHSCCEGFNVAGTASVACDWVVSAPCCDGAAAPSGVVSAPAPMLGGDSPLGVAPALAAASHLALAVPAAPPDRPPSRTILRL